MDRYEVSFSVPLTENADVLKEAVERAVPNVKDLTLRRVKLGGKAQKAKGNGFERKVAEKLGVWWWGKPFRRTPASGAWDKQHDDGRKLAMGDIYAEPEAKFPYVVECKKRAAAFSLLEPPSEFWGWWVKVLEEAKSVELKPLLVFGFDRKGIYVARLEDDEPSYGDKTYPQVVFPDTQSYVVICTLDQFIAN